MKAKCPRCGGRVIKAGHSRGKQRYYCRPCDWHGTDPAFRAEQEAANAPPRDLASRRYVITSAQNATPAWQPFLAALRGYCAANSAELVVIPYRYKNPTSMWSEKAQDDDWWSPELAPYLFERRKALHKYLTLLADIKTQPTANSPTAGFETITGPCSAIIGHPKIELQSVPTPQSALPKLLTTTGAVTIPNYLPSKAGKKGEFHHTAAAVVVELAGKAFHIRHVIADHSGGFYDLDRYYPAVGPSRAAKAAALVMGDTHAEFADPGVVAATFGPQGILATIKPEHLVWHDVHDFYARNHHHRGEVFINYGKHHSGLDNVERGLDETFAFIDRNTPSGVKNVFVASNHPEAFARWVKETDPRLDPENAVFWARTFETMCLATRATPTGVRTIDPFKWWAERKLRCYDRSRFLGRQESMPIAGVEVGYHGDKGPNGAKGAIRSFGKIGVRSVIGHSHSPGIKDGVYQVGTSSMLALDYTAGPSSWLHTHCVIYPDGKRSLIHIIGGKWRG